MSRTIVFFLVILMIILPSCRLYRLEQQLDSKSAEFLSKVRYIVTKEERKIFLELPGSEKKEFIDGFWQRRDPNPDTEENEFKVEYLDRIDRATDLFHGEGRPGWQTDRGRIYILFGPPTDRIKDSMSGNSINGCREVWYYGGFPVVFFDQFCNETYELAPINLAHLHSLNRAQFLAQKTFEEEKGFFDFTWEFKETFVSENRIEGLLTIKIPYSVIWFKSEGERLFTTLDINLELEDSEGNLVWEHKDSFGVEIDEISLQQKKKNKHKIQIPFTLEEGLEKLRQARNRMHVSIKNQTGGEESKKVIEFRIK